MSARELPSQGGPGIDDCVPACTRLCVDFVNFVDTGRYEEFVALFAKDGRFSRSAGSFEGHDALRKFLADRPRNVATRHLCTNVSVQRVSAERARGTCLALMFQAPFEGDAPKFPLAADRPKVVAYVDEFVLADGGWRFQSRRAQVLFTS